MTENAGIFHQQDIKTENQRNVFKDKKSLYGQKNERRKTRFSYNLHNFAVSKPYHIRLSVMTEKPCVVTIGYFDGVHCGHRYLLAQVKDEAKRHGMVSAVVTFHNHPLTVVQPGFEPLLISSPEEKEQLLKETGLERVEMLHFSHEMSQMSSEDFMVKVLREKMNAKRLVMGYDNRIGHDRLTFDELVALGRKHGIEVVKSEEYKSENQIRFSSSQIRRFLLEGEIENASYALGRHYCISGEVVGGFKIGRSIGYPTANVKPICKNKLIPRTGVYAVKVYIDDRRFNGMMNIGLRPTFHQGNAQTLEANIFDFSRDIYNENVTIEFIHYVREEMEFKGIEQLKEQIQRDEATCRNLLAKLP